jgi:hypothetical protein
MFVTGLDWILCPCWNHWGVARSQWPSSISSPSSRLWRTLKNLSNQGPTASNMHFDDWLPGSAHYTQGQCHWPSYTAHCSLSIPCWDSWDDALSLVTHITSTPDDGDWDSLWSIGYQLQIHVADLPEKTLLYVYVHSSWWTDHTSQLNKIMGLLFYIQLNNRWWQQRFFIISL